jgi:hypothetical protein
MKFLRPTAFMIPVGHWPAAMGRIMWMRIADSTSLEHGELRNFRDYPRLRSEFRPREA